MALVWRPIDLSEDGSEARFSGDPAELVDAFGELLDLIRSRPAWHAEAACRTHPELNWFPVRGADVRPVLSVCEGCAVRAECRDAVTCDAPGFGAS